MGGEIIGIVMVFGIVAVMVLGTIGGLVIGIVSVLKGGTGKKGKKAQSDEREETALIQEMHRGLVKMAERVESLETLVVNDDRYKSAEFERKLNED